MRDRYSGQQPEFAIRRNITNVRKQNTPTNIIPLIQLVYILTYIGLNDLSLVLKKSRMASQDIDVRILHNKK